MSNVGFGQIEDSAKPEEVKNIYSELATKYALKNNTVVNLISFEDDAVGYEVIDELVSRTYGVPFPITFSKIAGEHVFTQETVDTIEFEMMTGFLDCSKQFCFNSSFGIKIDHPSLKIVLPD